MPSLFDKEPLLLLFLINYLGERKFPLFYWFINSLQDRLHVMKFLEIIERIVALFYLYLLLVLACDLLCGVFVNVCEKYGIFWNKIQIKM